MKKLLIRTLPVLGLLVVVWLILIYLKPKVYDIPVPQNFKSEGYSPVYFLPKEEKSISFGYTTYDSITVSSGLEKKVDDSGVTRINRTGKSMPIEWMGFWKQGFKYVQLLTPTDRDNLIWKPQSSVYLESIGFHLVTEQGIFKENYEGNEIVLRLEKKNPRKILALWENFIIAGETNGEQIKIQIPAAATKLEQSLIRVWCCDEHEISRICEIPLHKGLVAAKWRDVEAIRPDKNIENLKIILREGLNFGDSIYLNSFLNLMHEISEKSDDFKICLSFGDFRILRKENYDMILYNYFGHKVLCVFNRRQTAQTLNLAVKGDLKKSANGTVFKIKSGKLSFTLPANAFEVFY